MSRKSLGALVPMKGHSERVPGKNMRLFAGKPLFFHILSALQKCEAVSDIYVDTDSRELAEAVTSCFGSVRIIWRPAHLVGDFVSMNRIIEYDLTRIDGEHFLQTHSTNPLLGAGTIDAAIGEYFNRLDEHDSLFSVNELHTRLYDSGMRPVNHDPARLERTQDLPPLYEENSNLYIFSKASFKESGARIGRKPGIFITGKIESMDIDTEEDFLIAESIKNLGISEGRFQ